MMNFVEALIKLFHHLKVTKANTKRKAVQNRAAKKVRRRNRVKGSAARYANRPGRNSYTKAQDLINNNWGLTFSNPEPARAGQKRAAVRLIQHRKIWS